MYQRLIENTYLRFLNIPHEIYFNSIDDWKDESATIINNAIMTCAHVIARVKDRAALFLARCHALVSASIFLAGFCMSRLAGETE